MGKSQLIQRKPATRLRSFAYTGSYAYFLTCSTRRKRPHFANRMVVESLLPILEKTSTEFRFSVYAYCFMPDHLHLLIAGEETSSLRSFMTRFKQRTGFAFKRVHGEPLWQRGYYDHVLRNEEALGDVASYIFHNPVRKGLVSCYRDYPFLGSFAFDVREPGQA